jgi:hypothetical protein
MRLKRPTASFLGNPNVLRRVFTGWNANTSQYKKEFLSPSKYRLHKPMFNVGNIAWHGRIQ